MREAVLILAIILIVIPRASSQQQQVSLFRCQKSGCREEDGQILNYAPDDGDVDELPSLVISKNSSSSLSNIMKNVFPMILSWMMAFFLVRLTAHYVRKFLPIVRGRILPDINSWMDNIMAMSRAATDPGAVGGRRRMSSRRTSSRYSLTGSLAEIINGDGDDSDDDDNGSKYVAAGSQSSTGYSSSGFSSYYSGYACKFDEGSESQSKMGLSSVMSSSSQSATQSSSGLSIVSKFLNYAKQLNQRDLRSKRRSSLDYSEFSSHKLHGSNTDYNYNHNHLNNDNNHHYLGNNAKSSNHTTRRQRRSTVDEVTNPYPSLSSYLSSTPRNKTTHQQQQQPKPATEEEEEKKKEQESQQHQHHHQQNDKEESNKNKRQSSLLQHHLSKLSSSSLMNNDYKNNDNDEGDDENYSTLSTVDLRTRVTRDTT
jgi:hypothetical protein